MTCDEPTAATRSCSASSTATRTASPTTRSTRRRVLVEYAPELRAIERTGRRSSSTRCASTPGWCSRSSSRAEPLRQASARTWPVRCPGSRASCRGPCPCALGLALAWLPWPLWLVVLVVAAMVAAARVLVLVALAHPFVAHEVDRLVAGAVAAAVAAPVLLVRRRHVQVDRRPLVDATGWRLDDHRLRQDQSAGGGTSPMVIAAIDAGLVDADRDAGLGVPHRRPRDASAKARIVFMECSFQDDQKVAPDRVGSRRVCHTTCNRCPRLHKTSPPRNACRSRDGRDRTRAAQPPRAVPRPDPLGPARRLAAAALAHALGAVDRRRAASPAGTCWSSSSLGTILMRSAGCAANDVADREFDRHVKRTAARPVTSGAVARRRSACARRRARAASPSRWC